MEELPFWKTAGRKLSSWSHSIRGFRSRLIFVDVLVLCRSLSAENLLLRGSSLKNTERVFGIAIYTGRDTKMAKNSKFKPHKTSTVESVLNKFLVIMLLVLILEAMMCAVFYFYYMSTTGIEEAWYLFGLPSVTEDVTVRYRETED